MTDGNRTAEFRHYSEAATLGITPDELHQLQQRNNKRRKVAAPAPIGGGVGIRVGGATRRPLLAGGKDADGNGVPPVALNFLGDLMPTRDTTCTAAAAAAAAAAPNIDASGREQHKDSRMADEATADDDDPWMANAHRLVASIGQMSNVLQKQEAEYVDLYGSLRNVRLLAAVGDATADANAMTDAERNALDAAVASFAVSTGNQIEALRRALTSAGEETVGIGNDPGRSHGDAGSSSSDMAAHRVGIVACLVSSLRTDVVDRMGRMHAVRMRRTLDLARDPLQCRLPTVDDGCDGGRVVDFDGDDEYDVDATTARLGSLLGNIRAAVAEAAAAEPSSEVASTQEEKDFYGTFGQEGEERLLKEVAAPLPPFPRADGADIDLNQVGFEAEQSTAPRSSRPNASSATLRPHNTAKKLEAVPLDTSAQHYYGESTAEQEAYIEDLQRESAYLTASLQNELEDVHKIENKMMEITTLLRQFGDMVAEQQEDIVAIHEQAEKSKKNVQAGQDNLVDAGERKKKSKHYMATLIASMGLLLLFLNWITP